MSDVKVHADFMYQTDFETNENPTTFSNHSKQRIESRCLKISPKSFIIKTKCDVSSSYSFRTPKMINKKYRYDNHKHVSKIDKPLEKTFLNPIIPKYRIIFQESYKESRFPNLKIIMQGMQSNNMKNLFYPMTGHNKLKYPKAKESFHFNN